MPVVTVNIDDLEKIVLEKCESYVNMGVWPAGEKLRPEKWLANFEPHEREHSLYLLNAFTYYNIDMSLALLRASFVNLSNRLPVSKTITEMRSKWTQFIADTVFVPVIGENYNITDSGNILAGHLRRDLNISETKIYTVDQIYNPSNESTLKLKKNIVFFDDFVGSGKQFNAMWTENYQQGNTSLQSVCDKCANLNLQPYYCAMIGTEYGIKNVSLKSPEVDLSFAHILLENASPLSLNSTAWPSHLKDSGPEFILSASRRIGIAESELKGFHNLGLAIAFSFTVPDSTLPLFHTKSSTWTPLMERS